MINWLIDQLINYAYQWPPVSIQCPNSEIRNKLWSSYYEEVHVQEDFKLVIQGLKIKEGYLLLIDIKYSVTSSQKA